MSFSRIPCKFGDKCENKGCLYAHGAAATFVGRAAYKWWESYFGDEACDPISLEPLRELEYEPFEMHGHWFDGCVLASYVVSSAQFMNPMTREAMTRGDCLRLDQYAKANRMRPHVTQAYDLLEQREDSGNLRREATTVLHALFGYDENSRSANSPSGPTLADALVDEQRAPPPSGGILLRRNEEGREGSTLADALVDRTDASWSLPPPGILVDEGAGERNFPALIQRTAASTWNNVPSFAEALARPPPPPLATTLPPTPTTQQQRAPKTTTKRIPQEIWVAYRDPSVFDVRDPMERYDKVQSYHSRRDVLDLHFQSSRTAPQVLDVVLPKSLDLCREGVWIVTGSGHHAPINSHQKLRGHLHATVQAYLEAREYRFRVGVDSQGHAGAFYVFA